MRQIRRNPDIAAVVALALLALVPPASSFPSDFKLRPLSLDSCPTPTIALAAGRQVQELDEWRIRLERRGDAVLDRFEDRMREFEFKFNRNSHKPVQMKMASCPELQSD